MAGFKINTAGTHYEHVVGFGDQNTRVSSTGSENVELYYLVRSERMSGMRHGIQIHLSAKTDIQFTCSYSLRPQIVSNNIRVTGMDVEVTRTAIGQLRFEMTGNKNANIGGRNSFSIVPKTPGAVYFTTKNCEVTTSHGQTSYPLIYDNGDGQCTDDLTRVTLDSTNGWSTTTQQDFSYTTFKFNSPGKRGSVGNEVQIISCEVHPSIQIDYNYSPAQCGSAGLGK